MGEHVTDTRGERHLLPDVPRQPRARDEADRARQRHDQHVQLASRPPSPRRSRCSTTCCKGRFIMGISPGGLMSDAEVFGNYRQGPQRHLPRVHRHGARDLEGRGAVRPQGPVLRGDHGEDHDPGDRAGHDHQALPEAAPADRGHRRRAALEGRHRGRQARLDADLRQLPAARMGGERIGRATRKDATAVRKNGERQRAGASRSPSSSPTTRRPPKTTATAPKGRTTSTSSSSSASWSALGGRGNLFKLDQSEPDSSITADTVTPKLVIAGTVDSVVDQILAFREKVGPFGTLYYPCHDWLDPPWASARCS